MNIPRKIESNIVKETKKPKFYLVTSKIVNLFAIFVATISVSTFFATRYIGLGDIFFSANIFSTMLAISIFIVILEIYGRKNTIKAFMSGAYSILLVFFISAFITDFNPVPVGYYQGSFINFHQTVLLSVFISYVISFLLCIKVYLYMKDDLNIPYLWGKALPAIAVSQILYTISYYLIYHGFSNLDVIAFEIKNELYLKLFMMVVDILIIYFIISGIRSGFFDILKNIFPSRNNYYIDENNDDYQLKQVFDENIRQKSIPYNKQLALEALENYAPKQRGKRYLPDYSEEVRYYDDSRANFDNGNYDQYIQQDRNDYDSPYKNIPQLKRSRRRMSSAQEQIQEDINPNSSARSNRRVNRKAVKTTNARSSSNSRTQDNYEENDQPTSIDRKRVVPNRSASSNTKQQINKASIFNEPNNNDVENFANPQQASRPVMRQQNKPFISKANKPFGNNNQIGNQFGQQNSQQSFFANKFNQNNKPTFGNATGGFNNMNNNNIWNKR